MSRLTPCLWFDGQAKEAAEFYASIFPNSRIDAVERAPGDYPSGREGEVLTVDFTLDGARFLGLNGGPDVPFTDAVSFMIDCRDQEEIDRYWEALTRDGGEPRQCGWLKDKFGMSWQVVSSRMSELFGGPDPAASRRAFDAMMEMDKIEIAKLEEAYLGAEAEAAGSAPR